MPKEKTGFKKRMINFFSHHLWLKLIALVLAVLAWFYVRGEISRHYLG